MTDTGFNKYKIRGNGKIFSAESPKGIRFDLLEITSEGANIISADEFEETANVKLKINIPGIPFQISIKTEGIITSKKKADDGYEYEIVFTGLSENDKKEIDELLG